MVEMEATVVHRNQNQALTVLKILDQVVVVQVVKDLEDEEDQVL